MKNAPAVAQVVEALGVSLGGGGTITCGGVRVEFIVGGVVEVVDVGGAGNVVIVEAVVADLVVALGVVVAGISAKLVAVRVGLAAGGRCQVPPRLISLLQRGVSPLVMLLVKMRGKISKKNP